MLFINLKSLARPLKLFLSLCKKDCNYFSTAVLDTNKNDREFLISVSQQRGKTKTHAAQQ